MTRIALFVLILIAGTEAQAEIYKWTDEQGQVHYSDRALSPQAQAVEFSNRTGRIRPSQTIEENPFQDLHRQAQALHGKQVQALNHLQTAGAQDLKDRRCRDLQGQVQLIDTMLSRGVQGEKREFLERNRKERLAEAQGC